MAVDWRRIWAGKAAGAGRDSRDTRDRVVADGGGAVASHWRENWWYRILFMFNGPNASSQRGRIVQSAETRGWAAGVSRGGLVGAVSCLAQKKFLRRRLAKLIAPSVSRSSTFNQGPAGAGPCAPDPLRQPTERGSSGLTIGHLPVQGGSGLAPSVRATACVSLPRRARRFMANDSFK